MVRSFHILLILLAWGTLAPADPSAEISRLRKKGEIVVALIAEDTPPFVYTAPDKSLTGIDVELFRHAAKELGVRATFLRASKTFDGVIDQVAKGKADVGASALFPTLKRAESVAFTEGYWSIDPVLVVNRVEKAKRRRKDGGNAFLNDRTVPIGVFSDAGTATEVARQFPRAAIVSFESRDSMLPQMMSGSLTAAFIDELEEHKWRERIPNLDLYFSVEHDPARRRELSFALRPQDAQLLRWFNQFLKVSERIGTLKGLRNRFLGDVR